MLMIFFPNYSICFFQLIIGSLNRAKKKFIGKMKGPYQHPGYKPVTVVPKQFEESAQGAAAFSMQRWKREKFEELPPILR